MFSKKSVVLAFCVAAPLFGFQGCANASERLQAALADIQPLHRMDQELVRLPKPKTEALESTTVDPETDPNILWVGKNFTPAEARVLEFFQKQGITDRAALATLLGNVKQESKFIPNICEGGARVNFWGCRRGGYGLIQWTTYGRYMGLGRFAQRTGGNPSQLETQLGYLVTEREWKKIEGRMRLSGKSINYYMSAAYKWLGWGIHGARTHYSWQYYNALVPSK